MRKALFFLFSLFFINFVYAGGFSSNAGYGWVLGGVVGEDGNYFIQGQQFGKLKISDGMPNNVLYDSRGNVLSIGTGYYLLQEIGNVYQDITVNSIENINPAGKLVKKGLLSNADLNITYIPQKNGTTIKADLNFTANADGNFAIGYLITGFDSYDFNGSRTVVAHYGVLDYVYDFSDVPLDYNVLFRVQGSNLQAIIELGNQVNGTQIYIDPSIVSDSLGGNVASTQVVGVSGVKGNDAWSIYRGTSGDGILRLKYKISADGGNTWNANDVNIDAVMDSDASRFAIEPQYGLVMDKDSNKLHVFFTSTDNFRTGASVFYLTCNTFDVNKCENQDSWETALDLNVFFGSGTLTTSNISSMNVDENGNVYLASYDFNADGAKTGKILLLQLPEDANGANASSWNSLGYVQVSEVNPTEGAWKTINTNIVEQSLSLYVRDGNVLMSYTVGFNGFTGRQHRVARFNVDSNVFNISDQNATAWSGSTICDGDVASIDTCYSSQVLIDSNNIEYIVAGVRPQNNTWYSVLLKYDEVSWNYVRDLNFYDVNGQDQRFFHGAMVSGDDTIYSFYLTLPNSVDNNVLYASFHDVNGEFNEASIDLNAGVAFQDVLIPQVLDRETVLGVYNWSSDSTDWNSFTIDLSPFSPAPPVNTVPVMDVNLIEFTPVQDLNWFSYVRDGNLTLSFWVLDAEQNDLNFNVWISESQTQGTGTLLAGDINLGLNECDSIDWVVGANCLWDVNIHSSLISDGNYYFLMVLNDGIDTNFIALDHNFGIDNTAPVTLSDINIAVWQETGDANVVLTSVDLNSGVKTIYYQLDTDSSVTVSLGNLTVFDLNIQILIDGNYALHWFASDEVDNNESVNIEYILIDSTNPTANNTFPLTNISKDISIDNNLTFTANVSDAGSGLLSQCNYDLYHEGMLIAEDVNVSLSGGNTCVFEDVNSNLGSFFVEWHVYDILGHRFDLNSNSIQLIQTSTGGGGGGASNPSTSSSESQSIQQGEFTLEQEQAINSVVSGVPSNYSTFQFLSSYGSLTNQGIDLTALRYVEILASNGKLPALNSAIANSSQAGGTGGGGGSSPNVSIIPKIGSVKTSTETLFLTAGQSQEFKVILSNNTSQEVPFTVLFNSSLQPFIKLKEGNPVNLNAGKDTELIFIVQSLNALPSDIQGEVLFSLNNGQDIAVVNLTLKPSVEFVAGVGITDFLNQSLPFIEFLSVLQGMVLLGGLFIVSKTVFV